MDSLEQNNIYSMEDKPLPSSFASLNHISDKLKWLTFGQKTLSFCFDWISMTAILKSIVKLTV